jgi:hypothetical protein
MALRRPLAQLNVILPGKLGKGRPCRRRRVCWYGSRLGGQCMGQCVGSAARIMATWLQPPCGTDLVGAGPRWTLDSPRAGKEVPDRQTVEDVLAVERGSVRFGGFAERPEIPEDTRGLAQRERERERSTRGS